MLEIYKFQDKVRSKSKNFKEAQALHCKRYFSGVLQEGRKSTSILAKIADLIVNAFAEDIERTPYGNFFFKYVTRSKNEPVGGYTREEFLYLNYSKSFHDILYNNSEFKSIIKELAHREIQSSDISVNRMLNFLQGLITSQGRVYFELGTNGHAVAPGTLSKTYGAYAQATYYPEIQNNSYKKVMVNIVVGKPTIYRAVVSNKNIRHSRALHSTLVHELQHAYDASLGEDNLEGKQHLKSNKVLEDFYSNRSEAKYGNKLQRFLAKHLFGIDLDFLNYTFERREIWARIQQAFNTFIIFLNTKVSDEEIIELYLRDSEFIEYHSKRFQQAVLNNVYKLGVSRENIPMREFNQYLAKVFYQMFDYEMSKILKRNPELTKELGRKAIKSKFSMI